LIFRQDRSSSFGTCHKSVLATDQDSVTCESFPQRSQTDYRKGNHVHSCLLTYLRSEVAVKAACKCDRTPRRVNIYENELSLSIEAACGKNEAGVGGGCACHGVGIGIAMHIKREREICVPGRGPPKYSLSWKLDPRRAIENGNNFS